MPTPHDMPIILPYHRKAIEAMGPAMPFMVPQESSQPTVDISKLSQHARHAHPYEHDNSYPKLTDFPSAPPIRAQLDIGRGETLIPLSNGIRIQITR